MSEKQVEHIVFVKLTEEPTEEFFAIARGHLTKIKQEIPGILYLSYVIFFILNDNETNFDNLLKVLERTSQRGHKGSMQL